jgi:putative transposase
MPRQARPVFAGVPHHVTQRGIQRSTVFIDHTDGAHYLDLLRHYTAQSDIEVVAYCLMPNHVHLVLIPPDKDALHRTLKSVHGRYASRFNRARDRVGHLWQNRYFSAPLDSDYFLNAVRYVELNPVRARLISRADEYPWSSAGAHCGLRPDPLVTARPRSVLFRGIDDWGLWLSRGVSDDTLAAIRRQTFKNLPCGSESFISGLESEAGKILRPRPNGRPPHPRPTRNKTPFLK